MIGLEGMETANNEPSNIQMLCRQCHMKVDGRLEVVRRISKANSKMLIEAAAEEKRNRTHCQRGHLLSGENLYITPDGKRVCKTCRKIHKKNYRRKKCMK